MADEGHGYGSTRTFFEFYKRFDAFIQKNTPAEDGSADTDGSAPARSAGSKGVASFFAGTRLALFASLLVEEFSTWVVQDRCCSRGDRIRGLLPDHEGLGRVARSLEGPCP